MLIKYRDRFVLNQYFPPFDRFRKKRLNNERLSNFGDGQMTKRTSLLLKLHFESRYFRDDIQLYDVIK